MLQNIHLVARWLGTLEKRVERHGMGSHADYRVFMSAEPAPSPETHIIPQGLLENAIKITNEPPTGMYANLHKALALFSQVPAPCSPRAAPPLLPAPPVLAPQPRGRAPIGAMPGARPRHLHTGVGESRSPRGCRGWVALEGCWLAPEPGGTALPQPASQACRGCEPEHVRVYKFLISLMDNQA